MHGPELGAVAFVEQDGDLLVGCLGVPVPALQVGVELLYRRDDYLVLLPVACELLGERPRVPRGVDGVLGELVELADGLVVEVLSVYDEDCLVDVGAVLGYDLDEAERGERLAGAGRVPDVSSEVDFAAPCVGVLHGGNPLEAFLDCAYLVGTKDDELAVYAQ